MKTELAFTRFCLTQEVVLRATDDGGASIRNLNEEELDKVKSALVNAGFNIYGKPSPTFSFSLNWQKNEDGKTWTSKFFQNSMLIELIEAYGSHTHFESSYFQAYLLDENGNEKETIGCGSTLQIVKDIVVAWIKDKIAMMEK